MYHSAPDRHPFGQKMIHGAPTLPARQTQMYHRPAAFFGGMSQKALGGREENHLDLPPRAGRWGPSLGWSEEAEGPWFQGSGPGLVLGSGRRWATLRTGDRSQLGTVSEGLPDGT